MSGRRNHAGSGFAGDEFLHYVKEGMKITVKADGAGLFSTLTSAVTIKERSEWERA